MESGLYVIRRTSTGAFYVGSSVNIRSRWNGHRTALRGGYHSNPRLQSAWTKDGESGFEFIEMAHLPVSEMEATETRLLFRLCGHPDCYNVVAVARCPNLGRKFTAEHRARIAAASTGRTHSPETRAKLRAARSKQKLTEKQIATLRRCAKGPRNHTPEGRARISAAQKGNRNGSLTTAESRRLQSERMKARMADPEYKARMVENLSRGWARRAGNTA